jgi:hypothetical protein
MKLLRVKTCLNRAGGKSNALKPFSYSLLEEEQI